MQNKGLIRFFAIAFALVCLYQLSFTFVSRKVERNARAHAAQERFVNLASEMAVGDPIMQSVLLDSIKRAEERFYLDSVMNQTVFNMGIRRYTFREVKERELYH